MKPPPKAAPRVAPKPAPHAPTASASKAASRSAPRATAGDEPGDDAANPLFNQSLVKGLAVLCAFTAQRRSMTIAEVGEAAGMNKSSAQRMVYTLEQLGYLRKHPRTRRYGLTPRVLEIGLNYLEANPLIEIATPFLSELCNLTRETVCLTEPDGTDMVYLARFVSAQFVPMHMPIGSRIPMYCTGSGRAYLSALDPAEALALLSSSKRVALTKHTLTDLDAITTELARARHSGYALNREEMFLSDVTLGAPVVDAHGRPVASIHVVAPTGRWSPDDVATRLGPPLLQCARSVSNAVRSLA